LRIAVLAASLLLVSSSPAAVEIRIYYSAIERILSEQVFTQEGRRYVKGTSHDKCSYAFLEKPKVSAQTGRLVVHARFSGRSARNWFGRCVGLGDDFDLAIAAVPYYREGIIALRDVSVTSPGRDGFYIRRVRAALAQSLTQQFQYHVIDDARRMLEQTPEKAPYHQQLTRFQVSQVRAADDALELQLDLSLAVR
jgi:hypothetical protein